MPGRHSSAKGRRGLAAVASVIAVIASVVPWSLAPSAQAAIPGNFFTLPDTGGANDAVGQGDLTQLGRDDSDPNTFFMFWSWDNTTWPGNNTGDACALFDTDGDTNIDFAVCAEIGTSGANVVQTAASPTVWTCNNSKTDRCAGPTAVVKPGVTVTALGGGVSPPADLITDTDPFPTGTDSPNDSTIEIKISKLTTLPAGAALVNVCSYPSIGSGGNTDPKDCVANPGGGFLRIVKDAGGDTTTVFNFTSGGASVDVKQGTPSSQSLVVGNNYSISENVPAGWLFDSASCTLEGGGATGTPGGKGVTGITVESGKITTCNVKDELQRPHITLDKQGDKTTVTAAGQTINYTLTATNDGNVPLTNVTISDPKLGGSLSTCQKNGVNATPPVTLDPTDVLVCTASHQVTQADMDAGAFDNTASTSGTPPSGPDVTDTDNWDVTATQTQAIHLVKSVSPSTYTNAGDKVTYTLTATNTGNVTLTSAGITDPMFNSGNTITANCTKNAAAITPPTTLAPGDVLECTVDYFVTLADVNAGFKDNTATAHGTPPTGPEITDDDSATITAANSPGFTLDKTASPTTYDHVGQVITYTLTETNTGNKTLSNVFIEDPLFGGTVTSPCTKNGVAIAAANIPTSLDPGDVLQCKPTYTIVQADLDNGSRHNTATGHGTPPGGTDITHDASATITGQITKSIHITKTPTPTTYTNVGDVINYDLVVTNTGNVTLTSVTVNDPKVSNLSCPPGLPISSLAPGAHFDCTASHTIDQGDLDAGSYSNTATATGTPPSGPDVSDDDTAIVNGNQTPAIGLTKTPSTNQYDHVGQVVDYTLVATNTGNVTLTNVQITDPLVGGPLTGCSPALGSTLAPTDTMTCNGQYTITQADLDAGKFTNTGHTHGTPPSGPDVTNDAPAKIGALQTPALTVAKQASPTTFSHVGDVITYTVTATNTGNVTLSQFGITDPLLGGLMTSCTDGAAGVLNPPVAAFAPGDVMVCTKQYTIQQKDVQAGQVANTATGQGNDPNGQPVSATGSATVGFVAPPPPPPAILGITKSSVPANGSFVKPGDTVTYTLNYSNTGASPASGVLVSDALPADMDYVTGSASNGGTFDAATRTVSWNVGSIAAGASGSVSFAATVASTATNGEVLDNVAVLTAPGVSQPSNPDDVTVSVPQGDLTITKAVNHQSAEFGDTLTYTMLVGATGNKDQTNVVVTDSVPDKTTYVDGSASCAAPCAASESAGVVTWNIGPLAAGDSTTVSFKVTIDTPASAANGAIPSETIHNVAVASSNEDPSVLSNKVKTDVIAVLGVKHVRRPQHSPLPFTGLPFPLARLVTMSLGAVGVGSLMVQAARSRRRRMTAGADLPLDE